MGSPFEAAVQDMVVVGNHPFEAVGLDMAAEGNHPSEAAVDIPFVVGSHQAVKHRSGVVVLECLLQPQYFHQCSSEEAEQTFDLDPSFRATFPWVSTQTSGALCHTLCLCVGSQTNRPFLSQHTKQQV